MNKQIKVIIIILILLVLALGYIAYDLTEEKRKEREFEILQEGALQTIASIYQATENCQIVPIQIYNYTKSLIDVSCVSGGSG